MLSPPAQTLSPIEDFLVTVLDCLFDSLFSWLRATQHCGCNKSDDVYFSGGIFEVYWKGAWQIKANGWFWIFKSEVGIKCLKLFIMSSPVMCLNGLKCYVEPVHNLRPQYLRCFPFFVRQFVRYSLRVEDKIPLNFADKLQNLKIEVAIFRTLWCGLQVTLNPAQV